MPNTIHSSTIEGAVVRSRSGLMKAEAKYRNPQAKEIIPFAKGSSFAEVAERVIPDKDGTWTHPLYLYRTSHITTIGADALCRKTKEYLDLIGKENPIEVLSISAGMQGERLCAVILVRV